MRLVNKKMTRQLILVIALVISALIFFSIFCMIPKSNPVDTTDDVATTQGKEPHYLPDSTETNNSIHIISEPLWKYRTTGPVQSVSVSSNAQYIAAGSESKNDTTGYLEGELSFFSYNGTLLWSQKPETDTYPLSSVKSVAVNTDGRYIAASGLYGDSCYFNRNGAPLWIKGHMWGSFGGNIAIGTNGEHVISGSGGVIDYFNRDGHLQWGYATRHLDPRSTRQGYASNHVAVSSDGQHIAAVSEDGWVYFFDRNGYLLWSNNTGSALKNIAMTSYGRYIAAASTDHNVYYYDDAGNQLWNYTTGDRVQTVAINDDGRFIAAGSDDSIIYLFDRNGTLLWKYTTGAPVESVAINFNGNTLAAGSDDHIIYGFNQTGSLLLKYPTMGEVKAVAVSDDGAFIIAGSSDGNVYFFSRNGTADGHS